MFITVTAYLLVYVDDFLLTGNDNAFVARLIEQLAKRFSIKELGWGPYLIFLAWKCFLGPALFPNGSILLIFLLVTTCLLPNQPTLLLLLVLLSLYMMVLPQLTPPCTAW